MKPLWFWLASQTPTLIWVCPKRRVTLKLAEKNLRQPSFCCRLDEFDSADSWLDLFSTYRWPIPSSVSFWWSSAWCSWSMWSPVAGRLAHGKTFKDEKNIHINIYREREGERTLHSLFVFFVFGIDGMPHKSGFWFVLLFVVGSIYVIYIVSKKFLWPSW